MRILRRVLLAGVGAVLLLGALAQLRLSLGSARAERSWQERAFARLEGMGATGRVSILPLVDWHVSRDSLVGEAGVSYLVRTDAQTILFDTGFNRAVADPAPIEHNMRELGVELADVDAVFVSHLHPDHVGGFGWYGDATFSIGNAQPDLSGRRLFVPVPMTYPDSQPVVTAEPQVLGDGVASIGTISRQLFAGWVEEQALAVHVRGRGIVLVVGCGHQTLEKVIARTRALFDLPIVGVVGGLHYPVPEGRGKLLGIDVQRRLASGSGPLAPLERADVEADVERLRALDPLLVAVGGHDSSDEMIALFAAAFGERHRHVRVGEAIELRGDPSR